MKKIFLHTISFMMAILVLFSTMSFTVEKHFCGKNLIGQAVFSSVKKCKTESHSCGAEDMPHMKMGKDSCCSNKTICIPGQDELNVFSFSFDFAPTFFLKTTAYLPEDLVLEFSSETKTYPPYEPPQLVHDLQILCQVFII